MANRWGNHIPIYNTPEYGAFSGAKQRCTNPKNKSYIHYGGRGIEFRFKSFSQFLKHVGKKPSPKHSLDRVKNDGHYEVGNVRWSLPNMQGANQRKRFVLEAIPDAVLLGEVRRRGLL